jgi:hypothetical protein
MGHWFDDNRLHPVHGSKLLDCLDIYHLHDVNVGLNFSCRHLKLQGLQADNWGMRRRISFHVNHSRCLTPPLQHRGGRQKELCNTRACYTQPLVFLDAKVPYQPSPSCHPLQPSHCCSIPCHPLHPRQRQEVRAMVVQAEAPTTANIKGRIRVMLHLACSTSDLMRLKTPGWGTALFSSKENLATHKAISLSPRH